VFHRLVSRIVNKIASSPTAAPYNTFLETKVSAINFWMAWLDSAEEGGMVLNGLYPTPSTFKALTPLTAQNVLPTRTKFSTDGVNDAADLNFLVGLPTTAAAISSPTCPRRPTPCGCAVTGWSIRRRFRPRQGGC